MKPNRNTFITMFSQKRDTLTPKGTRWGHVGDTLNNHSIFIFFISLYIIYILNYQYFILYKSNSIEYYNIVKVQKDTLKVIKGGYRVERVVRGWYINSIAVNVSTCPKYFKS